MLKRAKILGAAIALLAATGTTLHLSAQAGKKEAALSAEWYQYRGPKRDGLSPDKDLLKQWPAGGPSLAWKATGIGTGYSSVAVTGKYIFTMGDLKGSSHIIALNATGGKLVWAAPVGDSDKPGGYEGPRSTPATDGSLVFGLGQSGTLVCVQAATGREVWRKNLKDIGGRCGNWGYAESPLLDGPVLVVCPGGSKGTVAAFNKANGGILWQSGELKDSAEYTSLVPADFGGIPQYVAYTQQTVAGIHAKTGAMLWKADRKGATAVIPTPVLSKEGTVFVASGYGIGCNAFQVSSAGGRFKVQEIYQGKQMENHTGGLVLVGDHVYGQHDRGALKCIELKTGKEVWTNPCVGGKAAVAYADGHLVVRSERGTVALVEASPEGYKETGRFDHPDKSGKETWPHPVIFGGKLYLRDQDVLLCYDLKGK